MPLQPSAVLSSFKQRDDKWFAPQIPQWRLMPGLTRPIQCLQEGDRIERSKTDKILHLRSSELFWVFDHEQPAIDL